MPENASRNDESSDDLAGVQPAPSFVMLLLTKVLYWAPVAFFALSIIYLTTTIVLNPAGRHERPKEPEYYFNNAVQALATAHDIDHPVNARERERAYNIARLNLNRLARHYRDLLPVTERFGNPYLLLADASRELAAITPPTTFRSTLFTESRIAYDRAAQLEDATRTGDKASAWNQQFGTTEREIAIRKARRKNYILYNLALVEIEMDNAAIAIQDLEDLRRDFAAQELDRLRNERDGVFDADADQQLPIREHELVPDDRIRTDFHIARAYDSMGLAESAENHYRIFLLRAPVGLERFQAQMRLADLAFRRGSSIRHGIAMGADMHGAAMIDSEAAFRTAAGLYSAIVESSPPESIRDEAYFRGGQSYLMLADLLETGSQTWWDAAAGAADTIRPILETYSGVPVPERTALLPRALGVSVFGGSLSAPLSPSSALGAVAGSLAELATDRRITLRDRRNQLLSRARMFFDGAALAENGHFRPDSHVMTGKSLLIEGHIADARSTLEIALKRFSRPDVQLAAIHGIADSLLIENRLDEAWQNYQKLPPQNQLPVTPLLSPESVVESLQRLGHAYMEQANALQFLGAWPDQPDQREELRRQLEQRQQVLDRAAEVHEFLLANYTPQMREELLITLAHLYLQKATDLRKPPFGLLSDLDTARTISARAARTFYRVIDEVPGSGRSEEALIMAGRLFAESGRHERAVETLYQFSTTHLSSEQMGLARNLLGLSYRALGLYDNAIGTFRENGHESTTAEGRRALYYLGETLLERGGEYLGGPESELNHPLTAEQQKDPACLRQNDIRDWKAFLLRLRQEAAAGSPCPGLRVWENLTTRAQELITAISSDAPLETKTPYILLRELNRVLVLPTLYTEQAWAAIPLDDAATAEREAFFSRLRSLPPGTMPAREITRFNRMLLVAAYPNDITYRMLDVVPEDESLRIPRTAREVFTYVRGLPGLAPESRPWRWSTFGLGSTFFQIAENIRRGRTPADAQANPETFYRRAADVLTEAIDRYPLYPNDPRGIRPDESPEDYEDIRVRSFVALYQLGVCNIELKYEDRAQRCFAALINERQFDEEFIAREEQFRPRIRTMHEQSFLLLGLSYYRSGKSDEALQAFTQAHDRLKNADTPYAIHMMGECHLKMGRLLEARRMFVMAENAARNVPEAQADGFAASYGNAFWRDINASRLRDLEYLRGVTARTDAQE